MLINLASVSQFPLAFGNGFTSEQQDQCKTSEPMPARTVGEHCALDSALTFTRKSRLIAFKNEWLSSNMTLMSQF